MTDSIILVGGGGHCKACIDVIETTDLKIAGILDKEAKGSLLNYKLIGTDDKLPELANKQYSFLITVGQIQSSGIRKVLFQKVKDANGKLAVVISSQARVSKHSTIGEGTIVMHDALVNAGCTIGSNCIINSKALIEHDCSVGDHTHISTAAVINGACKIGEGVFIGSNAVVANGVEIGNEVVVGAGSVVVKNLLEAGIYAGNPARRIR